jgi:hypothetical protein
LVVEQVFPKTRAIKSTVIWDEWDPVPDEDRVEIIRNAYEQVENREFCDRIGLVMGLTVPEAAEYGLLPFRVAPQLRSGDEVTMEQCREALIAEGASVLADPARPRLSFATEEDAKRAVERLIGRLPGSDEVWGIQREQVPRPE